MTSTTLAQQHRLDAFVTCEFVSEDDLSGYFLTIFEPEEDDRILDSGVEAKQSFREVPVEFVQGSPFEVVITNNQDQLKRLRADQTLDCFIAVMTWIERDEPSSGTFSFQDGNPQVFEEILGPNDLCIKLDLSNPNRDVVDRLRRQRNKVIDDQELRQS